MIEFECSACSRELEVSSDLAGRKVKCRYCDAVQFVPKPPASWIPGPENEIRTETGSRWAKNILILTVAGILLMPILGCGGCLALSFFMASKRQYEQIRYDEPEPKPLPQRIR